MSFWAGQRVVVTGGAGFLGRHVVERLRRLEAREIVVPRSSDCDLREKAAVERLLEQSRPDMIIHLAAVVGGIQANQQNPGRFFYDNAIMGIQLIEAARQYGISKFVCVGTVCAYPKHAAVPFRESELWNGYPEETNAPYGVAKKALLVQLQAYREQYGMNGIYLLPVNLYGPHDNFDPETSHVIPGLIHKIFEAKRKNESTVRAFGTGEASREFLFVEDAAEGIVLAAEKYDSAEPVNLGSGDEIKIGELAELIRGLCGFGGKLEWDPSKPDGQPRRGVDTSRAEKMFGFKARTGLREGLARTIRWYQEQATAEPALARHHA